MKRDPLFYTKIFFVPFTGTLPQVIEQSLFLFGQESELICYVEFSIVCPKSYLCFSEEECICSDIFSDGDSRSLPSSVLIPSRNNNSFPVLQPAWLFVVALISRGFHGAVKEAMGTWVKAETRAF